MPSVAVVVLGNVSQSPRMCYHAESFAKCSWDVHMVGYVDNEKHVLDNLSSDKIKIHAVPSPNFARYIKLRILAYILKTVWTFCCLFFTTLMLPYCDVILVQNPPGVPALPCLWLVARLRRSRLVIDWHNYGFSILQLALAPTHALVRLARWTEFHFGRRADANLCVTKAMQRDLELNHSIRAHVVYDCPNALFKPLVSSEKAALFRLLAAQLAPFAAQSGAPDATAFTDRSGQFLADRPALIMSSTSWTEDEDFSILFDALAEYDELVEESRRDSGSGDRWPELVCVVTGKGPMKAHYTQRLGETGWRHVRVCTPWLAFEHYAALLGAADLGVSLHMSSSGRDLPMKVVDMFGCALPVVALRFDCIEELVLPSQNGYLFDDSASLLELLKRLLDRFPANDKLAQLRSHLLNTPRPNWHSNWLRNVLPQLQHLLSR